MIITRHGDQRTRKRVGVNRSAVAKLAKKALDNGIARDDTHGGLRRYLDYVSHRNSRPVIIRVWSEKVWVYSEDYILITVLDLPQKYRNRANGMMKKGESDAVAD